MTTFDRAEACRDCGKQIEVGEWRFSPSENPAYTGEHWAICYDCTRLLSQRIDRRDTTDRTV